jgi:hypothetical protein
MTRTVAPLCRMCAETVPVLLPTSVIDARRRVGGAADRAALTGRCAAEYGASARLFPSGSTNRLTAPHLWRGLLGAHGSLDG